MSKVQKELKKGAFVNFWGMLGKLAAPAFLIIVNRFYGAEIFGYFITSSMILDIGLAFLTFGFKDGILIHVSKYADNPDTRPLMYNSMVNALIWVLISVFGFIIALTTGGQYILKLAYTPEFADSLYNMLIIMVLATPMMAFDRICISSTQGLKIMKYDSIINGGVRQIALLVFSTLFWFIHPDITGLAMGFFATQMLVFILSLVIYHLNFEWYGLFTGFKQFKFDKELIDFAIPQNLNMTLNRFITGVDILMLPLFGISAAMVGYYGAGAMIIREVRNVKLIFSSAFAPHIVRLFEENKFRKLSHHFSKTSALVTAIVIPILFLILIFREDLLLLIQPEFTGSTLFMVCLLPVPYLYSSFSLAGNILTMTGLSKLTLINTVASSILNTLLNLWLIPLWHLEGAAIASSLTILFLSIMELTEAKIYSKTQLILSDILPPHAAGLIALSVFISFSWMGLFQYFADIYGKSLLLVVTLIVYGAVFYVLKITLDSNLTQPIDT